jgi:very-short-patch-repair endonuclease
VLAEKFDTNVDTNILAAKIMPWVRKGLPEESTPSDLNQILMGIIQENTRARSIARHQTQASPMHKLIEGYLRTVNITFESEAVVVNLLVDILIPKYKLVIEIEGPGHWVFPTNEPTLNTTSRNEMIKGAGYELISLGDSQNGFQSINKFSQQLEKFL